MATFNVNPSSDISRSGWTETSDSVYEDLSVLENGTSTSDETTTADNNSSPCILGGVSLPGDFPADGADSIAYTIGMRIQDDKNIDPLPQMKVIVTTSGNAEIANATVSLGGSPTVFTDYTGSLAITGNNTDTGWTGHRLRLEPISNDTDHTDFEVYKLQAVVTYTEAVANNPPTFGSDPIVKANATEDASYVASIAGDATDPDSDPLTYSKVSGPAWLTVYSNGSLIGIPRQADVGLNSFTVSVSDGNGGSDTATLEITVIEVNDKPEWSSDPLGMGSATAGVAYSASVASAVTDEEGDPITFSKTGGPAWLSVGSGGSLSGTPSASDEGLNTFNVTASDGVNASTAQVTITVVLPANDPPTFNSDPISKPDATEDSLYTAYSLDADATDPEGDTLTFSKISGPSWLTIGSDGSLSGTPLQADAGLNSWTVEVSDPAGGTDTATLNITVIEVNDPPTTEAGDPIVVSDPIVGNAYSQALTFYITDEEGATLTFSGVTGAPSWLSVASNGDMTGTPTSADNGVTTVFTVNVSDGNTTTTFSIQITPGTGGGGGGGANLAPVFEVDPITLSAAVVNVSYLGSVANTAVDPEGQAVTYSIVSGPTWLTMSPTGELSGTPVTGDLGLNTWSIRATDPADKYDTATLNITVIESGSAATAATILLSTSIIQSPSSGCST